MLNWGNRFNICCFLDNNNYPGAWHRYEALLGAGAMDTLQLPAGAAFTALQQFYDARPDWLFGHLAYDLKNEVYPSLQSANPDGVGFPDLFFFRPRVVMLLLPGKVQIGGWGLQADDAARVYEECLQTPQAPMHAMPPATPAARLNREQYLQAVQALQRHIHRGDCYEVNFCRENYLENANVCPLTLFRRLNALSPAPFGAYYRLGEKYLACSSPERFLQRQGGRLISQPIKGTVRRGATAAEDEQRRQALLASAKERAENVMVVDLVRNDLSRTALPGSVQVSELFGIYSFAQVHHMISTVCAKPDPALPFTTVIKEAFPMGSMTGAPKLSVMQLVERYEQTRRGLFSGALGYIDPAGDFDFNVVIRSMLYNGDARYLSFQTGSAITAYADPEKEWEECLLKAEAMRAVLG